MWLLCGEPRPAKTQGAMIQTPQHLQSQGAAQNPEQLLGPTEGKQGPSPLGNNLTARKHAATEQSQEGSVCSCCSSRQSKAALLSPLPDDDAPSPPTFPSLDDAPQSPVARSRTGTRGLPRPLFERRSPRDMSDVYVPPQALTEQNSSLRLTWEDSDRRKGLQLRQAHAKIAAPHHCTLNNVLTAKDRSELYDVPTNEDGTPQPQMPKSGTFRAYQIAVAANQKFATPPRALQRMRESKK